MRQEDGTRSSSRGCRARRCWIDATKRRQLVRGGRGGRQLMARYSFQILATWGPVHLGQRKFIIARAAGCGQHVRSRLKLAQCLPGGWGKHQGTLQEQRRPSPKEGEPTDQSQKCSDVPETETCEGDIQQQQKIAQAETHVGQEAEGGRMECRVEWRWEAHRPELAVVGFEPRSLAPVADGGSAGHFSDGTGRSPRRTSANWRSARAFSRVCRAWGPGGLFDHRMCRPIRRSSQHTIFSHSMRRTNRRRIDFLSGCRCSPLELCSDGRGSNIGSRRRRRRRLRLGLGLGRRTSQRQQSQHACVGRWEYSRYTRYFPAPPPAHPPLCFSRHAPLCFSRWAKRQAQTHSPSCGRRRPGTRRAYRRLGLLERQWLDCSRLVLILLKSEHAAVATVLAAEFARAGCAAVGRGA